MRPNMEKYGREKLMWS